MTTIETLCPNCMADITLEPRISGDDYHPENGGTQIGYKSGSKDCPECGARVWPTLTVHARHDDFEPHPEMESESRVVPVDAVVVQYEDGVVKVLEGDDATDWLEYVSEASQTYEYRYGERAPDVDWTVHGEPRPGMRVRKERQEE